MCRSEWKWFCTKGLSGLLPKTKKWIIQGDTCAGKAFIGKESRKVREPRRTALPRDLVSGFMVMGFVSRLCLAHHSDSCPSLWCKCRSAKMDSSEEDSRRLTGQMDWRLVLTHVLPCDANVAQPRWTPSRKILGGWQDKWTGVSSPEFFPLVVAY